jgi:FkbM family methyltransferase
MAFFIVATYKNFLTIFADYAGLYRSKEMIIETRHGAKYKIRSHRVTKTDFYVINESWLYKLHAGMAKRFLKEGSTFIDIGAHIGAFTIYAGTQKKNIKGFAFEPDKQNFKMLSENITLNNLQGRVIPINKAVAGKSGEISFFKSTVDTGQHTHFAERLKDEHVKNVEEKVSSITLKDFFDEHHIERCDLMKIDCEGMEYDILYNTPIDYLKRVKAFSIEHHWAPGQDYQELAAYLKKHGYETSYPDKQFALIYAWQA